MVARHGSAANSDAGECGVVDSQLVHAPPSFEDFSPPQQAFEFEQAVRPLRRSATAVSTTRTSCHATVYRSTHSQRTLTSAPTSNPLHPMNIYRKPAANQGSQVPLAPLDSRSRSPCPRPSALAGIQSPSSHTHAHIQAISLRNTIPRHARLYTQTPSRRTWTATDAPSSTIQKQTSAAGTTH